MEDKNGVFSGNTQENDQYGQFAPTAQPPQMAQPGQDYNIWQGQPQKPDKKPGIAGKIFGGIVLSLVIMGLFVGVQFVVAIVMMIGLAFGYAIEAPGDVSYVTRMLTEAIGDGEFMTNLYGGILSSCSIFLLAAVGKEKDTGGQAVFSGKGVAGKGFFDDFRRNRRSVFSCNSDCKYHRICKS